jgi:hypothetical protein
LPVDYGQAILPGYRLIAAGQYSALRNVSW